MKNSIRVFISACVTAGLILLITSSFTIAIAFGALGTSVTRAEITFSSSRKRSDI